MSTGDGRRQYPEVVDLTTAEDLSQASNHSNTINGEHPRRRKRTLFVSLLDDEGGHDEEPEVTETRSLVRPRPINPIDPALARHEKQAKAQRNSPVAKSRKRAPRNDDLVVVSEHQLTPQERLREIQEQHRQGKTVEPRQQQHRNQTDYPHFGPGSFPGSNAAMLYTQHLLGGPLGPIRGRVIVPPRPRGHAAPRPRIWHSRAPHFLGVPPLPGLPMSNFQETLEQRELEQTLLLSMEDTSRRRKLDRSKLVVPPLPPAAREGFTHSLDVPQPLVCIKCERELGQPDPIRDEGLPEETKLQNNKVFVRGCGHVYCGQCTYSMKLLPTRARACLPECKRVSSKKRGTFREVFI